MRAIRSFVSGYPELISTGEIIRQAPPEGISPTPASVGAGEVFVTTGPLAQTGRIRATCITAGGNDVAQFSLRYVNADSPIPGSPPGSLSPDFQSPVFPTFTQTLLANNPLEENDVWLVITSSVDWVVGNVIDIDLVPGSNTTPWLERRFVGDANNSPVFSGELEWITQGPGAGSPLSDITIGMRSFDSGADVRTIRVNYMDAFSDTSPETPFASQPNLSGTRRMLLNEQPITYYITVNARRFIVLCELTGGTPWESCYCGFFLPYAGEVSYPYPICVGASDYLDEAASVTVENHSSWWDPREVAAGTTGSLQIRTPVGGTQNFWHSEGGNFGDSTIDNIVFPWGDTHQVDSTERHVRRIEQMARSPRYVLDFSPFTLARAYNIMQSTLVSLDFAGGVAQQLGFLDGVYHITGENNAPGNTFVLESPEVTYLVGRSTHFTTRRGYVALRMDP